MRLCEEGKVVIEVGINEFTTKQQNPNVPYGPDEVAADLTQCFAAGATLAHFHARYRDGSQAWLDADVSREALDAAAEKVDLLAYPSYLEGRLDHILELADQPGSHRIRVSPFDPHQHVGATMWDEASRSLSPLHLHAEVDQISPYPPVLDDLERRSIVPNLAVFTSDDFRWTICAARAGYLRSPANIKFFLSEKWVLMNDAEPDVLDFYIGRIPPEVEHETVVVPYQMRTTQRTEALMRRALELGCGIRVGIGDNPDAFPTQTNAELVEWAVGLVRAYGFDPASPSDFRRRSHIGALTS